jgi:hypothetical protein
VASYANQHPAQTLVVMPAVPLRAEAGLSAAAAARARAWAEWLAGDFIADYTTQGNVRSFDLFDFWADAEDHATNANALQRAYSQRDDDHPNDAAYSAAADAITVFLTAVTPGASWQNPVNRHDVNGNGNVTPLDALLVINYINAHPGNSSLPAAPHVPPPYLDVNGDGICSALDVLLVINDLNSPAAAAGEGEPTASLAASERRPAESLVSADLNARQTDRPDPVRQGGQSPTETPTDVCTADGCTALSWAASNVAERVPVRDGEPTLAVPCHTTSAATSVQPAPTSSVRRVDPARAANPRAAWQWDGPLSELEPLLDMIAEEVRDAWGPEGRPLR